MMRSGTIWFMLLSALILLGACSGKTAPGSATPVDGDSLVAYLERTPCFGICPWYTIHVYKSGFAVYEGKRDAPRTGKFSARISQQQLESIGKKATELDFFELQDEYRNERLTDFPTVYVEVRYKGKRKAITHYDANPPAALTAMEDYIDKVFENTDWQKLPDPKQME